MTKNKSDSGGALRFSLSACRDASIVAAISIYGLYAGSGFLIPLTLALLAFVLINAISDRILRLVRVPVLVANLLAVTAVLAGLFLVMYTLGTQATNFARAVGSYETEFDNMVNRVVSLVGADVTEFVRVNLIEFDMSKLARSAFGGATSFLNTFLLISLYVAFLMAERKGMHARIMKAAGGTAMGAELNGMMAAITSSLQSYVGVKTFVSALTGTISYAVFKTLGLEFAETWAVLTFALNFIPSIGSIIAVVFPALVSLLQYDTITPFLIIVLFCGSVQFLIGNLLDPALLGRSLNMSTFMVILALTFWSSIWGVIGAFLSVPLTVCILIVFSHIPALRPIAILMSQDGNPMTTADAAAQEE